MTSWGDLIAYVIGCIVSASMIIAAFVFGVKIVMEDAIHHGAARYVVTEDGRKTFEWRGKDGK